MDFSITDDQKSLQDLAAEILGDVVTHDHLKVLEAQSWSVFDRDLWRRLVQAGIVGIAIPEPYGGGGLGFLEVALVCEQVGRTVAPVPAAQTLTTSYVLGALGPAELAAAVLPGVASGERLLVAALEGAGEVDARRTDGNWTLAGDKGFVPYGADADVLIPASSDDGPVLAFVRHDSPGVSVTPLETTNREPQALLSFDAVVVPDDLVVSDATELILALDRHLTAALCAVASGVCQAALAMTAKHTASREQFGKPIASYQLIQELVADTAVETDAARLLTWRVADLKARGEKYTLAASQAKYYASEVSVRAANAAVQVHGGYGYVDEFVVGKLLRDARVTTLYEGTSQVQKLLIGRALTGISAF